MLICYCSNIYYIKFINKNKKETDRCTYLLPSSCHPGHITKNIPYSLAYRLLRICSKKEWFEERLVELKGYLQARQYSAKIITNAFEKVRPVNRSEALKRVMKDRQSRDALVLTYHPSLPSVSTIIRKHWNVMTSQDETLAECFVRPSVVAYKRSKSLRDILVRSKLEIRRNTREKGGSKRCRRNCTMCAYAIVSQHHEVPHSKVKHVITTELNCESTNVIYKLTCAKCNKFLYIGETSRKACTRFQEHRGYISQKITSQPTGLHFTSTGHTVSDIRIQVIEKVRPHDDFIRKARESYWIIQYRATTKGNNLRK